MPLLNESHVIVHDAYHGREIADPYRWLEMRSHPDTDRWIIDQQGRATFYFRNLPEYECLATELSRRLDVDVMDEAIATTDIRFCRLRRQGQQRASIYFKTSDMASWRALVNAGDCEPSISVNLYRVSSDGSTLAFLKRTGGSDQASVHCLDVTRGTHLEACLDRGYARGLVLCPLRDGFFYCHEAPSSNENHQIRFSGFSGQDAHELVFERPRSEASKLILSGDESCLGALHVYERDGQRFIDFWVSDSGQMNTWRTIFEGLPPSSVPFVRNKRLFLLNRADRGGFDISEFDVQGREMHRVASSESADVRGIATTYTHMYLSLQQGMATEIRYWGLTDREQGTITADAGEIVRLLPSPMNGNAVYYARESYAHPSILFEHAGDGSCEIALGRSETGYEKDVSETSYTARDGTSIPATLIRRRKDLSDQPAIILVYGAFGSSLLPQFSVLFTLLIDMDAVLAVLHVRGGGENGRRWHHAGKRQNKTVSVSDVIDGIEWLTQQTFINPNRIALYGASAGGLLVASVAMKIPERLRAVVCIGPLLDMLRYDKFGLARRWKDEFGTTESSEDFEVLVSYSPYHNVTSTPHRPAFLFVTGDEDDRCDPAHVRKMVARLMETSCDDQPVLVDYSASRGHCPALPLSERVTTLARRCAFLARELDLDMRGARCT